MLDGGDSSGVAAMADAVVTGLFEKAMDNRDIDQSQVGDR